MPTQLRAMMRQQGKDLHAEFCALLPTRPQPIRIQRWSLRRVALTVWVLFMAWLAALIVFELLEQSAVNRRDGHGHGAAARDWRLRVRRLHRTPTGPTRPSPTAALRAAADEPERHARAARPVGADGVGGAVRARPGRRWIMAEFTVRDGSAVIDFGYQYGGPDKVTIEVRPTCDVGDAREVSSVSPAPAATTGSGTAPAATPTRSTSSTRAPARRCGSTWPRIGADLRGAELLGALGFVTRADLDRQIRAATDGRLTSIRPGDGCWSTSAGR